MYALINARIYDYHNYYDKAFMIFDEKIRKVGLMVNYVNDNYLEIDLENKLIIPGFVTGHTHLYSTFARGMSNEFNPKNFLEILKQLWWKLDHFLDRDMIFYSALMGGLNQLKMGTTTLIDHHASTLVDNSLETIRKAINDRLGLRGIFAFETSDRFDVKASIKENLEFIKSNNSQYSRGLFGMHASLSLSDESLKTKSVKNLGEEGIHIHVAESLMDEERMCKKLWLKSC